MDEEKLRNTTKADLAELLEAAEAKLAEAEAPAEVVADPSAEIT